MCIRDSTTSSDTLFANTLSVKTLAVEGVSTFTGLVEADGVAIDNVQIGVSGDNKIDTSSGNLTLDSATGQTTIDDNLSVTGILSATSLTGHSSQAADFPNGLTATTGTFSNNLTIGVAGTVGFGTTAYFPDNTKAVFGDSEDLSIFHDGTRSLISDQGEGNIVVLASAVNFKNAADNNQRLAILSNGVQAYSVNVLKFETVSTGASVYNQLNVASLNGGTSGLSSHFGSLRYGDESGGAPYSTRRSLDLINTDSGNINYYINFYNKPNTGDFHWH